MLSVHPQGGSILLCEMTLWLASWNYDVISEIRQWTWWIFLPSFIPVWFETMEP